MTEQKNAPERIWEDWGGNPIVGGKFEDFDITGNVVEFISADLHDDATRAALAKKGGE